MNRNDEFSTLMDNLETTPPALEYTVTRAKARAQAVKIRRSRAVILPLGSLGMLFAVFTILVNVSPSFAYAAGRIPIIKDLALAVASSPSLSAAVENKYVQPIDEEQSENGITARVEYIIVDQMQLNIFYTLNSDMYTAMDSAPEFKSADGGVLHGYASSWSNFGAENGDLRKITADFNENGVPSELILSLRVHDNGSGTMDAPVKSVEDDMMGDYGEDTAPEAISTFEFSLSIDPYYTAQGETIEINQEFLLDGQKMVLETAEIYPTHMRFTFSDFPENTAWLTSLEFYVENEKGERFDGVINGISAIGSHNSPMMKTHMLESAFFSNSKHLTLHITEVTWLSKDMEKVHVDLKNETADKLPQGVNFEKAVKKQNGWIVYFSAPIYEENHHYQLFSMSFYDKDGEKHEIRSSSTTDGSYYIEETDETVELEGRFAVYFPLKDYTDGEVWLEPIFSDIVKLDTPVSLEIK